MTHPSIPSYDLFEQIGEGGFGLVYKARQTTTGQLVAIKLLKNNPDLDEQKRNHQNARFERETKLNAQINHPHIVKLLDKGYTDKGDLFAVFEYVEGQTLKSLITQNNGLTAPETSQLMGQVLDALVCAHEQGIVHRDLKPQNIMVTQTGAESHVKVLDFGIGAFTHEYRPNDYKSLTLTKEMVGTPSYSAPEQLRGEPPTTKSDLYAWGLILVECLTGKTVMSGDSLAEIFKQQLDSDNIALPAAIIGHDLTPLLRRVLDKNPRTRTADAAKLYEEYKTINFNTIVGKIAKPSETQTLREETTDGTIDNAFEFVQGQASKQQITVLCVQLSLDLPEDCALESELWDTLQKDQLNSCSDTIIRYGGYIKGELGNCMMAYFGYPQASDNAARRAGRTALELVNQTQKRAALLQTLHGISLDIRISLHADEVLIRQNQSPEGLTPDVALNLLHKAKPQVVLVSENTKQLLDPYLEFEIADQYKFANASKPIQVYALLGERQTEAMSFLRPWSANRQMIGRDAEKQQIIDLWEKTKAGEGISTLISGQAGIGKSKLTYEAKKQLRSEGFVVRECRCLPEQENNALFPFFDMFRKHWGLNEGDNEDSEGNIGLLEKVLTEAQCELASTLPILCSWLSIPLTNQYEISQATPEKQKEILLNTLEQLILNIAKGDAFLLIVEDLHWLDPTSQEFLERLLAKQEQQDFLLLMTTRPQFNPAWEYSHLATIELQPLNKDFIQHIVQGVLGDIQVDEKVVDYIAKRADGIPLFIEELTHMLEEQGYLILKDDTYQLDEKQDAETVPVTLKDLLNTRLDRLGLAKETAQLAATIGRNFDYDLLVRASLRDEASVQADLDELMNADLVYRQRRVQGESYIFRHALIRDAAYDGMPKAAQKDTHGRIATTLEVDFPDLVEENPFEVARHFAGGEEFESASEYGIRSAQQALDQAANEETVMICKKTLTWNLSVEDLILKTKNELEINKYFFPAITTLKGAAATEMLEISNTNTKLLSTLNELTEQKFNNENDHTTFISQYTTFQNYMFAEYQPDDNISKSKLAIKLGRDILLSGDREKKIMILPLLGEMYQWIGNFSRGRILCKLAIKLYNDDKDKTLAKEYVGIDPKSQAHYILSQIELFQGHPYTSIKLLDKALLFAKDAHSNMAEESVILFKLITMYFCNQPEDVISIVNEFYHTTVFSQKNENWVKNLSLCVYDWATCQTSHSISFINQMLEEKRTGALHWVELMLAETEINKGNTSNAIKRLEDVQIRLITNDDLMLLPTIKSLLAQAYFRQNQIFSKDIQNLFEEAIYLSREHQTTWLELHITHRYCSILCEQGTLNIAEHKINEVLPKLTEGHNTVLFKEVKNLLDTILSTKNRTIKP